MNLKTNLAFGIVSDQTCSKIKKAINLIIDTASPKKYRLSPTSPEFTFDVNFITLTLPSTQVHSDTVIKHDCMNPFLVAWRGRDKDLRYVWRAEKQANGNIHFHILSNSFYHYKNLREDWNRIIERLGYVDAYANNFVGMSKKSYIAKFKGSNDSQAILSERWELGESVGWRQPNSTDVHAIGSVNDVAAYVAKYAAKQSAGIRFKDKEFVPSKVIDRNKVKLTIAEIVAIRASCNIVEGKIWGCDRLTGRFKSTVFSEFDNEFSKVMDIVVSAATYVCVKEFITVYYGNFHKLFMSITSEVLSGYQLAVSEYLLPPILT